MNKIPKLYIFMIVLMVLALLAISCTPQDTPQPTPPPVDQEPEPQETPQPQIIDVSLRLPWIINAQAAGPFTALEKGYFVENGLNVSIEAGGPDANSITLVAAGTNTFGLHDMPSLILARAQGLPLVSVAAFWQKHPGCVFALEQSGIQTLQDFEGRSIGFKEGGPWILTQAMLKDHGVDLNKIETISVGFGIAPILTGQVDLLTAFCTNEPLAVQREGEEVVTFVPFDYGIETSTEVLFTTDQYYQNNSDIVCRMVDAIRRGWEYALDNKEEAINIVLKYGDEELDFEQQLQQLEAQADFIITDETEQYGIGYMTADRWSQTEDVLREQGILEDPVDVNQTYTMDCLP
jgi:NitT/TauT family transport system substrate-binding protein